MLTTTSTAVSLALPAGVTQVSLLSFTTTTDVAATPLNVTVRSRLVNPYPRNVCFVPPAATPISEEMDSSTGATLGGGPLPPDTGHPWHPFSVIGAVMRGYPASVRPRSTSVTLMLAPRSPHVSEQASPFVMR